MKCRAGCGACCIAPSISSSIPGMPEGKKASQACIHLTKDRRCNLFNQPERPKVCKGFQPSNEMCGKSFEEAMIYLEELERATR